MSDDILPDYFMSVARALLRHAYVEYLCWQPDGDWDTFMSWAKDERPDR